MLWQNGRRLAYYSSTLSSILKAKCIRSEAKRSQWYNSIGLLMKPSSCFPGILGPKCTLSLHIHTADTVPNEPVFKRKRKCYCSQFNTRKYFNVLNGNSESRRQKPVCHTDIYNESTPLTNLRKYA